MPADCHLDISVSPLSPREVAQARDALRACRLLPTSMRTVERFGAFLLETRAEGECAGQQQRLAETVACAIWRHVGRFVRIVVLYPDSISDPDNYEFGERDYRRLLRAH